MKILSNISFRHVALGFSILLAVGCLFIVRYAMSEFARSETGNETHTPVDLLAPENEPEPPEDVPDFFRDGEDSEQSGDANGKQLI
jgi:hypothetical protein